MSSLRTAAGGGAVSRTLDMLLVENPEALGDLVRDDGWQVLDPPLPSPLMEKLSEEDATLLWLGTSQRSQKLAWRVSKILARRYGRDWQVPPDVLAEALFFPFWAELCTFLACRRAARHFAAQGRRKYLVPLPSLDIACFKYWHASEASRIALALELAARGAEVALVKIGGVSASELSLTFRASRPSSPMIGTRPLPFARPAPTVVCAAGIRRMEAAPPAARAARNIRQRNSMRRVWLGDALFGPFSKPAQPPVSVRFARSPAHRGGNRLCGRFPDDLVFRVIEAIWAGPATKGWLHARELVARRKVREAFVCDHHFFESALVAGAVKEAGGRVHLLPHSTSPVHTMLRTSPSFDSAFAATKAGAGLWRRAFPGKNISVRSAMALPAIERKTRFDAGKPLTVVVMGGAENLGGLPIMRIGAHKRTYEKFFSDPRASHPNVSLVFKPKPGWEDEAWFAKEIGRTVASPQVTIDGRNVLALDHPNMVFVSLTYASSALLEGIAHGVPAILVTEQQVENYVPLEHSPVPMVSPSAAWDILMPLREPGAYDALSDAQIRWLGEAIFSMPEDASRD